MNKLPDRMLIGTKFWRRYSLILDLEANTGSVRVHGDRVKGSLRRGLGGDERKLEDVHNVIEGDEVDHELRNERDHSAFSKDIKMQKKLRDLLWSRRAIFKGLGKIVGVKHKIQLKPDAAPVCCPVRRRSPREEEIERKQMTKLINLGVLEPSVSPWAAQNVSYRRKTGEYG